MNNSDPRVTIALGISQQKLGSVEMYVKMGRTTQALNTLTDIIKSLQGVQSLLTPGEPLCSSSPSLLPPAQPSV